VGGFAINQWLMEQGFLVLHEPVDEVTSFDYLRVNWPKTRAWCYEGYSASVFLNVRGREPQGTIPPDEYELFRDELRRKFEALADDKGVPLNAVGYKPDQLYRQASRVSPDLIVQFSNFSWRVVGSVGHQSAFLRHVALPDACNHSRTAVFALIAPSHPLSGEYEGARVLDMAPTLLDLAGLAIPGSMQGRSLVAGMQKDESGARHIDGERLMRQRLEGLGYV